MIIKTLNDTYRPGDDDERDAEIQFSCNSIYVVGAETRAALKDVLRED